MDDEVTGVWKRADQLEVGDELVAYHREDSRTVRGFEPIAEIAQVENSHLVNVTIAGRGSRLYPPHLCVEVAA
ncbi:MAG: hypothetical protein GY795_24495 [Desulfobacterales bacterium]|nr:hypothetical protein [Desulfobacterales bacterium]